MLETRLSGVWPMRTVTEQILWLIAFVLFLSLMSKLAHAETLEDVLQSMTDNNAVEWSQQVQPRNLAKPGRNQCHTKQDCQTGEGCLTLWTILNDKVGICMN